MITNAGRHPGPHLAVPAATSAPKAAARARGGEAGRDAVGYGSSISSMIVPPSCRSMSSMPVGPGAPAGPGCRRAIPPRGPRRRPGRSLRRCRPPGVRAGAARRPSAPQHRPRRYRQGRRGSREPAGRGPRAAGYRVRCTGPIRGAVWPVHGTAARGRRSPGTSAGRGGSGRGAPGSGLGRRARRIRCPRQPAPGRSARACWRALRSAPGHGRWRQSPSPGPPRRRPRSGRHSPSSPRLRH